MLALLAFVAVSQTSAVSDDVVAALSDLAELPAAISRLEQQSFPEESRAAAAAAEQESRAQLDADARRRAEGEQRQPLLGSNEHFFEKEKRGTPDSPNPHWGPARHF